MAMLVDTLLVVARIGIQHLGQFRYTRFFDAKPTRNPLCPSARCQHHFPIKNQQIIRSFADFDTTIVQIIFVNTHEAKTFQRVVDVNSHAKIKATNPI